MTRSLLIGILSFAIPALNADELNQKAAPIGIKIEIKDFVIPGPELKAKPLTKESAVVLRITSVYPHGNSFRYNFEYYGLEAGSFDLGDFLLMRNLLYYECIFKLIFGLFFVRILLVF